LIDFKTYFDAAAARARKVDFALESISVNEAVMGGEAVFRGTRVPIDAVLASLAKGVDFERLRNSYSFLTSELIEAATIYTKVRPRRGRPRRVADGDPSWKVKSIKIVRQTRT